MKKSIYVYVGILCLFLYSCGFFKGNDNDTAQSAQLSEKYNFYENSDASIRDGCNVSSEEAAGQIFPADPAETDVPPDRALAALESSNPVHTDNGDGESDFGSEKIIESTPAPTAVPTPAPTAAPSTGNNFNTYDNTEQQNTTAHYVLNTKSLKIHYLSCRSVPKIAPKNYATSDLSLDELQSQGYTTCGICFK